MSRSARLHGIEQRLRTAGSTTADALANEFGVSARTLYRDLRALREQGLAIAADAGRGGGIRLDGSSGAINVRLSVAEIVSLWLAARLSRHASDLPWSAEARSALNRLLASLPRAKAAELRQLCQRVFVGPEASPEVRLTATAPASELLRRFEEAFSRRLGLAIAYTDATGRKTERRVEPHGLLVQPPVWYLLARDVDKRAARMFRLDRIGASRVAASIHFRPDPAIIRVQVPPGCEPLA